MTPPAGTLTPNDHHRLCARVAERLGSLGPECADPRALATVVAELRSWTAATFVGAKAFAAQDALDAELVREAARLCCTVPRRKLVQARPLSEPLRSETWAQGARAAFALDAALERALLGGAPSIRLPAMILASAILRGGLLRAEAWPVLLDALRSRTLTLSRAADLEDMPWIDLALPSSTTSRPVSEDGVEWVRVWPGGRPRGSCRSLRP